MFTQVLLMAAAVLVAGSLEGLEAQERPDFSVFCIAKTQARGWSSASNPSGRKGTWTAAGGGAGRAVEASVEGAGAEDAAGVVEASVEGAGAEDAARVVAPVEVVRVGEAGSVRRIKRATA